MVQGIPITMFPEGDDRVRIYQQWAGWVNLFFYVHDYHTFPRAGGLDDQDWLVMDIFTVVKDQYGKTLDLIDRKKKKHG